MKKWQSKEGEQKQTQTTRCMDAFKEIQCFGPTTCALFSYDNWGTKAYQRGGVGDGNEEGGCV